MSVVLTVQHKNSRRDVAILQSGRLLRIGRADDNDVVFAADQQMSGHHATLLLQDGRCFLTDLESTNGTWINDESVTSVEVGDGTLFRCGGTEFTLEWLVHSGKVAPSTSRPASPETHTALEISAPRLDSGQQDERGIAPYPSKKKTPAAELDEDYDLHLTSGFCRPLASQIIERFQLHKEISLTPEDGETPQQFIERLMPIKDGAEVVHFLAFALPRRRAVMWLVQCLRSDIELTDLEAQVLDLVEAWVNDPTEDNRIAPAEFVAEHSIECLTTWPAQAAFYSHGSVTPPNCPKVPPKDELAGKTVQAGVSLAIVAGDAEKISERRNACIQRALAGNL